MFVNNSEKIIGILPCSGACNVGIMTTKATVKACETHENVNFVCALGLPLGIPGIIENAKKSNVYLALNGCEIKCATKALESVGIKPDDEIVVLEKCDMKKNKNFSDETGLDVLMEEVENFIQKWSQNFYAS